MRKIILLTYLTIITTISFADQNDGIVTMDFTWNSAATGISITGYQGDTYLVTNAQLYQLAHTYNKFNNSTSVPNNNSCPTKAQMLSYGLGSFSTGVQWAALGGNQCPAIGMFGGVHIAEP